MRYIRQVVVFDAADIAAESAFWAGMLDGQVIPDESFHCVIDADGQWRIGVQLAPDHTPPDWPNGNPQPVHMDLHVEDPLAVHTRAIELGARVLQADDDFGAAEGHRVYADPAGHPFCVGWGHPDQAALRAFLDQRSQLS